jgi:hypothetical protein
MAGLVFFLLVPEIINRNYSPILLTDTNDQKVWMHVVVKGAVIKF